MGKIEFECGCSVGPEGVDFDNINYGCKATWDLLGTGKTQGVFQIESGLGKQLSKKLKPDSIEELSALTAIMRPGVLKSKLDGKSLTEHFIDRKHGREPTEFLHPALEPILKDTYSILTYQEQVIKIAQDIAGFDLKAGDDLRKGIGKKIAKVLAELKEKFIEGCLNKGIINKEQAETIFEWIYNSSRYSFNKCVSGDTIIDDMGTTVEHLWKLKNSKYAEWKKDIYLKSSKDNKTYFFNKLININLATDPILYRVKLPTGYIDVTKNHKFPTNNGIKKLSELTMEDKLYYLHVDKLVEYNILSIKYLGRSSMTYDVEMAAPYHNFIANNILTCNSHAVAYGVLGYWTAWIKQHFPLEFYTSWLIMAKEKQDPHKEIAMLVNDARTFNIDILPPSIFNLDKNFHIDGAAVRFGLIDIKKIGDKQVDKIKETFNGVDKGIKWFSILINHLPKINSACAEAMISAGMFDFTKTDRRRMLYEFNIVKQLSDAHIKLLQESNTSNLKEGLEYCINKAKKVSLPKLTSLLNALNTPPYRLVDEIPYLAGLEGEYLGVALTCSRSSGYNYGDTVCLDVINGKIGDMIIVAEITNLSEYKINNKGKMDGRTMCYIALQDDSAELQSCVMFPDNYEKYKTMLYVGGVILLKGNKQKDNNLIIETIKCL